MNNHLIVSVLAEDRLGLVHELSRAILDCGCTVLDSRITVLAGEFSALLLVSGNWNTLAKLEVQLEKLSHSLGILLRINRSDWPRSNANVLPYAVEVITMHQPAIIQRLANFFFRRDINIEELHSRGYSAPHTATPMFAVTLIVGIPARLHVATVRDEFMDFCDEQNWDAVMEPVKA